jgi:hypothetical protein
MLVGSAALSFPAAAGDRHHHHHHHHRVEVVHVAPHVHVPWYHQPPWIGTGPGYYYSHHPDHIPAWPKPLTGYPVPIYDVGRPVVHVVPRYRVVVSGHVEWCAARYRSYDVRTDTWQPYHGPRRHCRSPYR